MEQNISPELWSETYPECAGEMQSPININTKLMTFDENLPSLHYCFYDMIFDYTLSMNSKRVAIELTYKVTLYNILTPSIYFGRSEEGYSEEGLSEELFELKSINLYWGRDNSEGSQHLLNGNSFPLEMHLSHKSRETNMHNIAFLFELTETDNEALSEIINATLNVEQENNQTLKLSLNDILPKDTKSYIHYMGSLTTQPCTQDVRWTIIFDTIKISENQMKAFHGLNLEFSNRPIQALNERIISTNFEL